MAKASSTGFSSFSMFFVIALLLATIGGFFVIGPLVDSDPGAQKGLRQQSRVDQAAGRAASKCSPQPAAECVCPSPAAASSLSSPPAPAPSCPAVAEALLKEFQQGSDSGKPEDEEGKSLVAAELPPVVDELPPRIAPSLYGRVHQEEPFERATNREWELHTIPSNRWVDRANDKIGRCLLGKPWPGEEKLDDEITWVSLLLDLKRGEAGNNEFRRPMSEYYARFQRILDRGFKMVIFIPKEFESHLKIDYSRVKVIHFTGADLVKYFPYYDRLTKIRTSDVWNRQAKLTGWLSNAPQARLPLYDPLVMSKMNLLRDVSRVNPWNTKYLMFMDAGHACATELRPGEMPVFRDHMSKFFLTHWPYATATEVHGMLDKAMHLYMGTAADPLRIVRGGVFGGQRGHIECVAKAYNTALAQTLSDGYMGTEENIFAMIFERFPELFNGFDNNSLGNHGDNCAAFQKNAIEVRERKEAGRPMK